MRARVRTNRINLRGTSGPESDLAAVRVYLNGALNLIIPTAPQTSFSGTATTTSGGKVLLEHSFMDALGNESPRFQQYVSIPKRRN